MLSRRLAPNAGGRCLRLELSAAVLERRPSAVGTLYTREPACCTHSEGGPNTLTTATPPHHTRDCHFPGRAYDTDPRFAKATLHG